MTFQELAKIDLYFHQIRGSDLNPFSTQGARHMWTLGHEGQPLPEHVHPESPYAGFYKRGQEAAKLQEQEA